MLQIQQLASFPYSARAVESNAKVLLLFLPLLFFADEHGLLWGMGGGDGDYGDQPLL